MGPHAALPPREAQLSTATPPAGPASWSDRWPGDLASPTTPVARDADEVARLASNAPTADHLDGRVSVCRACPRLVAWREEVCALPRKAYAGQRYWGRPVTAWGPARARVVVIGLAPAAHGGNRTGRMFTGDRSGDWLFAALHRAGLSSSAQSVAAGDGLELLGTRVTAAVHCAPPANKPTMQERDTCRPWLVRDLELAQQTARAVVVLGGFAWAALWPALRQAGWGGVPAKVPVFGHGVEVPLGPDGGAPVVLGCYHPSQQNTFTGRLTLAMIDAVMARAAAL